MRADVQDFILSLRGYCILDDFETPTKALPVRNQINLPDSVVTLMAYVDDAGWTEEAELIVRILMSSVHPDVESSVAMAALLPRTLRLHVARFLSDILVDGLGDEQRHTIFSWTQCWALASLDQ
jgi:hypothetical protein